MYKFTKANIFHEYLIKIDVIKEFNVQELDKWVVFETNPTIQGSRCNILIAMSNNTCVDVIYTFAQLKDIAKEDDILRLLNEMNSAYRLRLALKNNGRIEGRFEYVSTIDEFNPDLFFDFLVVMLENIIEKEIYPKVMKAIWS